MKLTRFVNAPCFAALFVTSVIWLLASGLTMGQDKKPPAEVESEPSIWMKKKMDYSKSILEGLASGDFDKIAENAQAMQGLSQVEWFIRRQTPAYRTQLEIFLDANKEIIKQAKQDNLEGSALAFTQLTISCVNCHKQLRESK